METTRPGDDPVREQAPQRQPGGVSRLEQALAGDEFVLYYQPKVDLRDGHAVGAEALIRWQHPQRGLLVPRQFLHLIDDAGFAAMLGRWVIATAVAQLDQWLRAGLDVSLNVNIAAQHLRSASLVDDIGSALDACPTVPPDALELELNEATACADVAGASMVVDVCRHRGVRFALDNFGSGPASLSQLRRLGVDTLKIDQSLVCTMLDNSPDQAMVEAIIGLGRAFRLEVVAEGVETAAHCAALINLGCAFGQGYGIARPMAAEEFADWMHSRPRPSP